VKLATDSIRPAGAPRVGSAEPCYYDPPETVQANFGTADDIWGLGVTLVEALTQSLPWSDQRSEAASLPIGLPAAFTDTVRRCLSYDPATRPSAVDLQVQFGCAPATPSEPAPAPVMDAAPHPVAPSPEPPGQGSRMPIIVALVFLILLAAVWADLRLFRAPAGSPQSRPATAQVPVPQSAAVPPNAVADSATHSAGSAAVHLQMPKVSRSALKTIHGRIKITVLVDVDRLGTVTAAHLKNTGPSSYFARLAREAAQKWTFVPAEQPGTRQWLVRFEFTSSGATGVASPGS
jgi:TonB family protein